MVGLAEVEYFSSEFNEYCPDLNATAVEPMAGQDRRRTSQRFEHPQLRQEPNRAGLPINSYLDDAVLDNPWSHRVEEEVFTEYFDSIEYVPDGDLLPLPHDRTQMCHYALRLTRTGEKNQLNAAWSRFKQLISYGFETQFHFRVLHRNTSFTAQDLDSPWELEAGSDGFAFVVQNDNRQALGSQMGGLGYAIPQSIAVEFDMSRGEEFWDVSNNHISVHIPLYRGLDNNAWHYESEIAYTDDIPFLQEGTHEVRIRYDPRAYTWDSLGQAFESDLAEEYWKDHNAGKPGLFTVHIDGFRAIAVPIDLQQVVFPDGTALAQADPPVQPNESALDEGGSGPGRAWVGFTASTSLKNWQAVDILSWTFTEFPGCPGSETDEMICRNDPGTANRSASCFADGSYFCEFLVQNAARKELTFSAKTKFDKDYEVKPCSNSILQWDGMHPYFLGCARTLKFTHDMRELWVHTVDGARSVRIWEPHLLQQDPALNGERMGFKRRSLFRFCIAEHPSNAHGLQFAECNCEYCVRVTELQAYYQVFYQHRCATRYGDRCPCFEVSEVTHDQSAWTTLQPMKYMRVGVCRGCAYHSNCNKMLAVGLCEEAYNPYFIGNPLAPTILSNGFENLLRDNGRVEDGQLRGDACICEPTIRPYIGDPEGRRGMCSDIAMMASEWRGTLDQCFLLCDGASPHCNFFTLMSDGMCMTYSNCAWELCREDSCFNSNTYRMTDLGLYVGTDGDAQVYPVYPKRTVQTEPQRCFDCLHLYEDRFCAAECGPPKYVTFVHYPAGQSCATCMLAGNRMHELLTSETKAIKQCVYDATRDALDPWVACDQTVRNIAGVTASDLFNGVATHYLSECPARPFYDAGAVCVPNMAARLYFESQLIDRRSALNNTVWYTDMECMNALCQLVPKSTCYYRMTVFPFNSHMHGVLNDTINVYTTSNGGPVIRSEALELNLGAGQYLVTDPLPFECTNITLEVWVTPSLDYIVTNLATYKVINASNNWREDYEYWFMTDGDMGTYWSSHTGQLGNTALDVEVILDLNATTFAGEIHIFWKEPAADFEIWTSLDNETYWLLVEVTDNVEETTVLEHFFQGRFVKLIMTKAAALRPPGQLGAGLPVYSIREFEVLTDVNEARLKPTWVTHTWNWTREKAGDGDNTTFWSTQPHSLSAQYTMDLGQDVPGIVVMRFMWRYKPFKFNIFMGPSPCAGMPSELVDFFIGAQVEDEGELILSDGQTGGCIGLDIEETGEPYGVRMVAMDEVQVFAEDVNIAPASGVLYVWPPVDPDWHLTPVANCLDNNPATYWWFVVPGGDIKVRLDLGLLKRVVAIEVIWGNVELAPGNVVPYQPTHWQLTGGQELYGEVFEIDTVFDSLDRRRKVTMFELFRWVELVITTVANVGDGRCAIQEFIITEATDNLIPRPSTIFNASSEWIPWYLTQPGVWCSNWNTSQLHLPSIEASELECGRRCLREPGCVGFAYQVSNRNCANFGVQVGQCYLWSEPCINVTDPCWDNYEISPTGHIGVNGSYRLHGPEFGVDGDMVSWWGGSLGYDPLVLPYLEVQLAAPMPCDFAIIRWKYPAEQVNVYILSPGGDKFNKAGGDLFNTEYTTPIIFTGTYIAEAARVTIGEPLTELAGQPIMGIHEFELYSTDTDNALLNIPEERTTSTDGSVDMALAVDDSTSTKWASIDYLPVNITFDIGQVASAWGAKLVFPSAQIAVDFAIMSSMDGENWTMLFENQQNEEYILYIVEDFLGQYVKVCFRRTYAPQFGLRDFNLFGSSNILQGQYAFGSSDWNHSGFEAVDGINDTFFVSEPLAAMSTIRVDLLQQTYIIDGVRIRWRFPAQDFEVWIGDEFNYTREVTNESGTFDVVFWSQSWEMLYSVTGNLDNETQIDTDFEARYVEIRMYLPDESNGDWSYAIYDFDVMFDPNLAHGKIVTVNKTINTSWFTEQNIKDRDWEQYWMPEMGSDDGRVVVDFEEDQIICGFDIWWRRSPVTYRIESFNQSSRHGGFSWFTVVEFTAISPLPYADIYSDWELGFISRYFAVQIDEVLDGDEGKIVALRELEFVIPDMEVNYLLLSPVEVSQEDILGNPKHFITDGTDQTTYWLPDYGVRQAWFQVWLPVDMDDETDRIMIGRIKIWYRFPPGKTRVDGWYDQVVGWQVYGESETNACWIFDDGPVCATEDFYFKKRAKTFIVYIDSTIPDTEIGVLEIRSWGVKPLYPPKVLNSTPWNSQGDYMIDYNLQSYWMAPPYRPHVQRELADPFGADFLRVEVDIGQLYDVFDIKIWFGFRPQMFDVYVSSDYENWELRRMTSGRIFGQVSLEQTGDPFYMRYVRLEIIKSYRDADADPTQWGTSIRDFAVMRWRNLARNRTMEANSVWDYPVHRANDGDNETAWIGRFGAPEAEVVLDLGDVRNIAGVNLTLGYRVSDIEFLSSYDDVTYTRERLIGGLNLEASLHQFVDARIYHFQCRYVKIKLWNPIDPQFHPDYYDVFEKRETMMSIVEIDIWEHTGGGGIFGIQNLDGSQYSTLAYGLRQPGEWILASEQDSFTQDLGGGNLEDEGRLTQWVMTFGKVHTPDRSTTIRRMQVSIYRNGVYYGERYDVDGPWTRLNDVNQTRLVFGIRSTIFVNDSIVNPGAGSIHGDTHSAFFGGKIHNATLFKNALAPEEVRGLYLAASGGNESACHCFDACPMNESRHFPGVPVPCSGQGACIRGSSLAAFASGNCVCLTGFSGLACEFHCSDLSKWGCCKEDDDCPSHLTCDTSVGACTCLTSDFDCPEDRTCDVGGTNTCSLKRYT